MRERRSVNSQDARSIIDSARRELRISSSMVSSSTRLSAAARAEGAGRSPARDADSSPLASEPRSMAPMPRSQFGAALWNSTAVSRRRIASGGSATWVARCCALRSSDCTSVGKPASNPSM